MTTKVTKMLPLKSYTIHREGQVDWRVEGPNHCGPKTEVRDGVMPVRYSADITCAPSLDTRGFLFDQAALDLYMRRLASKPSALSCEMLARTTAETILAKIERDVPTCKVTGLALTLSPAPFAAGMTVRYGVTP